MRVTCFRPVRAPRDRARLPSPPRARSALRPGPWSRRRRPRTEPHAPRRRSARAPPAPARAARRRHGVSEGPREPPCDRRARAASLAARGGEVRQCVQAVVVLELVDVVEHEHQRLAPVGQRGPETGEAARPQRVAAAHERLENCGLDRPVGVQRLGEVRQEDDRIVVSMVERDPGELAILACCPLAECRRLSVSGRCDEADEAALRARERRSTSPERSTSPAAAAGRPAWLAGARTSSAFPFGALALWVALAVDASGTCNRSPFLTRPHGTQVLAATESVRLLATPAGGQWDIAQFVAGDSEHSDSER